MSVKTEESSISFGPQGNYFMKMNKKIMSVNLLMCLLFTENAMAAIKAGERKSSTSSSTVDSSGSTRSQGASSVKISEANKDNFQTVTGNTAICNSDQEKETYFPLNFFRAIARDEGAEITFEQKTAGNKVLVKVPPILNVCGQFTPEFRQDKDSKNVTILMKLYGTRLKVDASGVQKEEPNVLLTHGEFEACLKNKGLLDEKKAIKWDQVPSNGFSESVTSFDYDFDKKADAKKTIAISYGYAKSFSSDSGYPERFGFSENAKVPGESCMKAEMIAEKPVYINKGKDVLIAEINAVCQSGTAQEIANLRRTIGNAEALKDIADKLKAEMDTGYLIAAKKDVERIDKEMKKIEDKLNKEKDTLTESEAKKLTAKYAELAKELNTVFIDPAIMRLDSLMAKRSSMDDDSPELKVVDEEIKKLNEDISKFAKRNPTSFASVYSIMEKFAITDDAKVIEDIRLKSYLYSKVYAGRADDKRGKALSMEEANKQQASQMIKFDKVMTDWTDVYLVGQGNTFPIKRAEKERQNTIDRMNTRWANYEKKEYKDWSDSCGVGMLGSVKNPVKCKQWSDGLQRRRSTELKKREKDLLYVKGRNEKLEKMGGSYNEHQRKMASREEAEADMYEPYGSSYSSYEDNFSDRFPGYYGPTTSTAYNGSNFNMGGVNNSMMMGQQQMMMPQQQMQPGQFQMPQMGGQQQMGMQQMGGWPGM